MITRDAAHRYKDTEDPDYVYPSVTTILDVLDKSYPISTWASRQTAEAALQLQEQDALGTLISTVGREGAIKALTNRATWTKDEAAQLGTEVHALADLVIRGQPTPSMTEVQRIRVLHYAQWWKAKTDLGWTLRLSEAMVMRKRDDICPGWGGTFDLLLRDPDGKTVLADIKTGGKVNRKAYDSEVLQLAGYGMANIVQPAHDGLDVVKTYPMPLPDRYMLIHLPAEGVREIEVAITAAERMAFLAALDLHRWVESMKGKRY